MTKVTLIIFCYCVRKPATGHAGWYIII